MNYQLLWECVQENTKHIEIINKELGILIAQVEWLTWNMRTVIISSLITISLLIINIFLTKKNGKR